jgi:hypothetical protein
VITQHVDIETLNIAGALLSKETYFVAGNLENNLGRLCGLRVSFQGCLSAGALLGNSNAVLLQILLGREVTEFTLLDFLLQFLGARGALGHAVSLDVLLNGLLGLVIRSTLGDLDHGEADLISVVGVGEDTLLELNWLVLRRSLLLLVLLSTTGHRSSVLVLRLLSLVLLALLTLVLLASETRVLLALLATEPLALLTLLTTVLLALLTTVLLALWTTVLQALLTMVL